MRDMAQQPLSSSRQIGPAGLNRVLELVALVEDYDVAGLHAETDGGWSLALGKARLTWSADGTAVTKTLVPNLVIPHWASLLGTPRQAALNELRVNRLLSEHWPPVPVPLLLGTSRRGPSMTFEAVDGAPLGPKFPISLSGPDVDGLIAIALALQSYQPRRRWFRRLHVERRLRLHHRSDLIGDADAAALTLLAVSAGLRWHFAHGDITARNVECTRPATSSPFYGSLYLRYRVPETRWQPPSLGITRLGSCCRPPWSSSYTYRCGYFVRTRTLPSMKRRSGNFYRKSGLILVKLGLPWRLAAYRARLCLIRAGWSGP
jgi:hypothetical protein